ncbi:MAG: tRNA-binding protein [Candidatus Woesearchaeota archaeon]
MISWDDFKKVEMRVGRIIEANDFPKARKPAYQLKIDFGNFGIKQSSAQITDLYSKEDLVGKQIVAVTNLGKKQIANFISECLVLGVILEDGKVVLIETERDVPCGLKIE